MTGGAQIKRVKKITALPTIKRVTAVISVVSECSSYPSWTSLHRQVYQCERWGDLASSHCSSTLTRLPMMPAGSEVCNTNAYTVHQTQAWLNYSNLNWEHITRYCNKKKEKKKCCLEKNEVKVVRYKMYLRYRNRWNIWKHKFKGQCFTKVRITLSVQLITYLMTLSLASICATVQDQSASVTGSKLINKYCDMKWFPNTWFLYSNVNVIL